MFLRELEQSQRSEESIARDAQAQGYLEHSKFPTQIASFKAWLEQLPKPTGTSIALDLGCGPGPYTNCLLSRGHTVIAIDFSGVSLEINRKNCTFGVGKGIFVREDLNRLRLLKNIL